jgi:hypothetical protein
MGMFSKILARTLPPAVIQQAQDKEMHALVLELACAGPIVRMDISQSIADLYSGLSRNFGTIEALRAAPSDAKSAYFDSMLELQGRLVKVDRNAWAIARLFNTWLLASLTGNQEKASACAKDLAWFLPDNRFPPSAN